MAKVKDVLEKLLKLPEDTEILAVVLTKEEFTQDVIQGNSNPIRYEKDYARFLKWYIDGDGIADLFLENSGGESLFSSWEDYLDDTELHEGE
jgi:hypothetical protein